jgi:hypothetical protein
VTEFPDLAEIVTGKGIRLKVRLYKYPKSSTARLLGLKEGGSSILANFMMEYKKKTSHFTAPVIKHPVIVVYDNDDGAKSIRNVIKQISKVAPTGPERFVHVIKNMYAVPTPIPATEKDSKIEDFFGTTIKATVLDGKTFNEGNNFDADKHYGKRVFAHKVVRPKADMIDFTGFRPLLANIVATIAHHKAMFTSEP